MAVTPPHPHIHTVATTKTSVEGIVKKKENIQDTIKPKWINHEEWEWTWDSLNPQIYNPVQDLMDLLGSRDTWQKKGRAVTDGRYYLETLQLNTVSNIKYY